MAYVSLATLKKTIGKDVDFSLTVEPEVSTFDEKGGVAINFLEKPPNEDGDILFHFNPRPPAKIILNTFWKGGWGEEVVLENEGVRKEIFGKMFVLSIKLLSHSDKTGSEFLVFLNKKLQTTYKCPLDITKTKYIGFSPALRIAASERDFN